MQWALLQGLTLLTCPSLARQKLRAPALPPILLCPINHCAGTGRARALESSSPPACSTCWPSHSRVRTAVDAGARWLTAAAAAGCAK